MVSPSIVSPVTIDGGTRIRCLALPDAPGWLEWLERVSLAVRDADGWRAALAHGVADLTVSLDGTPQAATPKISGARAHRIALLWNDLAHLEVNLEQGTVGIQAKARFLWAYGAGVDGWRAWMSRVLAPIERALFLRPQSWIVTGLELCADAVGVKLAWDDPAAWVGARSVGSFAATRGDRRGPQTIQVGARGGNVSIVLYSKDAELRAHRKSDFYAPVHRGHGWDGESERIRCEIRFAGEGLEWEATETGEVCDLRSPLALCSQHTIDLGWAIATDKRRMVLPDATRIRRGSEADPWSVYRGASSQTVSRADKWRQTRAVKQDTLTRRAELSRSRALSGLATWLVCDGEHSEDHEAIRRAIEARIGTLELETLAERIPIERQRNAWILAVLSGDDD